MKIAKKHKTILLASIFIITITTSLVVFKTHSASAKNIIPKKMEDRNSSGLPPEVEDAYKVTMKDYDNGEFVKDTRTDNRKVCMQFQLQPGKYYSLYYGYSTDNTTFGISDNTESCNYIGSEGLCRTISECSNPEDSSTCKEKNYMILNQTASDAVSPKKRFGWAYLGCQESILGGTRFCAVPKNNSLREVCVSDLDPYSNIDLYITVRGFEKHSSEGAAYYEQFDLKLPSLGNNVISYDFANPHMQICNDYKDELDAAGKKELEKSIPYCFSDRVSYKMDETDLKNMLANFIRYYNDKNVDLKANIPANSYNLNDHNEKPNTKRTLKCDPFKETNENTYVYSETNQFKIQEETKKYYTDNQEKVNSNVACESICTEVLTVKYGPPKAVKAGQCFESEVIVKSSIECKSKVNFPPPTTPKKSPITIPRPRCVDNGRTFTQAGPSAAFDQCVQSCDGGKYSQKCIDKCYNETESTKNVEQIIEPTIEGVALSFNKNSKKQSNILKVANKTCPDPSNYTNFDDLVNAVWDYMHEDGNIELHGHFTKNPVSWTANTNCRWDQYAPWYFLTQTETRRTLNNDNTVKFKFNRPSWGWDWYGYDPLNGGFKWQTWPSTCQDYCEFRGYDASTFNESTNVSDTDYTKALKDYNDTVKVCTTSSSCKNTTSRFTISFANDSNKKGTSNPNGTSGKIVQICDSNDNTDSSRFKSSSCFKWNSSINYNNKVANASGNLNMIKDLDSQCAGNDNKKDHYYTRISFPGDWVKNKGGKVTHTEPKDITFYKKHDNQYCLDRDFGNINTSWWKWSELYAKDPNKKNIVDQNSLFYNILNTISDFGYFGWNFDVSCFFAVQNNPGVPDENPPDDSSTTNDFPECPKEGCGNVYIDEFATRATSLDNLFVSTKQNMALQYINKKEKNSILKLADDNTTNKKLHASRTTGYNWSNKATNLSISNYTIAPPAAIAMIQDMGDQVYSKDEELDYSITITPAQIKNIRSYNKKADSYLAGGRVAYNNNQELINSADYEIVDGIIFYKSSFLKDSSYTSINHKPSVYGCNNLKNGVCNKDYNGYAKQSEFIPGIFNKKGENVLSSQKAFK